MIFFALALSWVKELSENIIPKAEDIFLYFDVNRQKDKVVRSVSFGGFSGKGNRIVKLTNTQFDLLHHFASLQKNGKEPWLEIKPKNNPSKSKQYDISDYNEIKRLLIALLDGLFGKGNWTKEQHLTPLKNSLFELSEKRERKIRMRLHPSNIHL